MITTGLPASLGAAKLLIVELVNDVLLRVSMTTVASIARFTTDNRKIMASKNKMNKARNSYCLSALKWGKLRCKRLAFFDAAQRKRIKVKTNQIKFKQED